MEQGPRIFVSPLEQSLLFLVLHLYQYGFYDFLQRSTNNGELALTLAFSVYNIIIPPASASSKALKGKHIIIISTISA